jgi:hypothetical protein
MRVSRWSALVAGSLLAACAAPTDSNQVTPPLSMSVVSGDGQHGAPGTELTDPLVVRVEDARGRPVVGQIVNFRVVSGGGSVFAGAAISNRSGLVQERWTLGFGDLQRVEARAIDPATGAPLTFAVFTATFDSIPPSGDSLPPITSNVLAIPNPSNPGDSVTIRAQVSDTFTGGSNILGADVQVDSGPLLMMNASDGAFDQENELVFRTLFGLSAGTHLVCVRGRDSAGNTGSFVCILVTVGTGSSGDTLGPVTVNVSATPDSAAPHDSIMIQAEVRDTFTGGSNIAGAEMRVDSGGFVPMFATDGAFDQQNERVNRLVVGLAVGGHSVCVRGRDTAGNIGNETCIGFSVAATSRPGAPRRGRQQP